jgi:hypothetical protein
MPNHLLKIGLIGGMVIAIEWSTLGGSISVITAATQPSYTVRNYAKLGESYYLVIQ